MAKQVEAEAPEEGSKVYEPKKDDKSKEHRVKVYRMDENKEAPISVFVNDEMNRREFYPGQEVTLNEQLIDALKLARIESSFEVPPDSGIYEAQNPKMEAQSNNPGYKVEHDLQTGTLHLVKSEPKYVVEQIN